MRDETLKADGFDRAIIGTTTHQINGLELYVYAVDVCVEILQKQGMSYEDATEFFEFNVRGAYLGKGTPIFVDMEHSI